MAVTIKDIAAAAGVSPSTVSRTCKDSPSISRDTKERIRRIMAQMGYEPNFDPCKAAEQFQCGYKLVRRFMIWRYLMPIRSTTTVRF